MPKPGEVYPDAAIRQLRWSFPDTLAAELHAGLVIRLEVVARVAELRDQYDGPRWQVEVLEMSKASDE